MGELKSVELDCINKNKKEKNEKVEIMNKSKKHFNKRNENEINVINSKNNNNDVKSIFESFRLNEFFSGKNKEDSSNNNNYLKNNVNFLKGNNSPNIYNDIYNKKENGDINNKKEEIHYKKKEIYNECLNKNYSKQESVNDAKYNSFGNSSCLDIDEETKFLEDWEETQKKIYDPTIGLRKHYTNELLSCGEKNNIRILEKWSSMINRDITWFIKIHKTTYLRRVKRGIPQKYRWKIWFQITNAKCLISKFQKKYYYLSKKKSCYTNLILIDISRTFPELLIFDKYAQQQLYRILNAYSNYEPAVGYCQGMNFLVGLLLIVSNFNELETFCVLVSLMNNYHLKEFYKEKFPLLNKYIYVFEKILQNEIPDLVEHFNKEEVFPPVYLHQWMLTLFIASLPIKSVIVIWDFLFSTSIKMIIIISIALLKILKSYLMKHKFEKILKLLKSLKYNESNDDILIAKLLIKKSESIVLNEELKFLFDNIEKDNILFNSQCKYAIENITNYHFNHVKNDMNNIKNMEENYMSNSEDNNFVVLDGVPLLNFFSNNLLKKKSEEELKPTTNCEYKEKKHAKNLREHNVNTFYYKILSSNEKNIKNENTPSSKNSSNSGIMLFRNSSNEIKSPINMNRKKRDNQKREKNNPNNNKWTNNNYNKKMTQSSKLNSSSDNFVNNNDNHNINNIDKNDLKKKINLNLNNDAHVNTFKNNKNCNDNNINYNNKDNQNFIGNSFYENNNRKNNMNTLNSSHFNNSLSEDSCNSKIITTDIPQYDHHHDASDHLYKSDSFLDSYQKKYININSLDNLNFYKQDTSDSKNSYLTNQNNFTDTNFMRDTKQRKSFSNLKRHAYYFDKQFKDNNFQEEKKSESVIKIKMNKYEQELNEKEKQEIYKFKEYKNKKKKNEPAKKIEQKDKENILNISQYINYDENEQKNNNENNFGFFNLIHSYAKDNNWFDVSTINKYYHFNKNNMDYELDNINLNKNKFKGNDKLDDSTF
ncbi:GTPase-activating protein, putative [Plasmodium relictum]|uniref:GTPase-activating protein, putative n=1 Tax=Plasmodium relictum TaxID=85471 RepID=A0A1J1H2Z3_PLARL|nr:GTPase-activating protein, putative [Plasmodium relictum]CRG99282.1 GTPase-activating protein, putative [Plasmodium relictum]